MNLQPICKFTSRFYHSTAVCYNMKQLYKISKTMTKFVKKPTNKKKWYDADVSRTLLPSMANVANTKHEDSRTATRRVAVLNKMFIRHISDQMTTGEISEKLKGRDVTITKLKVTNDFHILNVYWTTKDLSEMEYIESILQQIGGILRHELSQLKLMGNVPKIFFTRDKEYLLINELDAKLAKADFGEDYKPVHYNNVWKSDCASSAPLDSNVLEKLEKFENKEECNDISIPPMTNNVFGLDRQRIMNNIIQAKNKSAEAWKRNEMNQQADIKFTQALSKPLPISSHNKNVNFKDFLRERQIFQTKLQRMKEAELKATGKDIINEEENQINDEDDFDEEFDSLFGDEEYEEDIDEKNDQSRNN